jgi:hypothetical protein
VEHSSKGDKLSCIIIIIITAEPREWHVKGWHLLVQLLAKYSS